MKNVLVGSLPPPVNGQSLAFQMLVEGLREKNIPVSIVNIASKSKNRGGTASWRRALEYVFILLKYIGNICFGKKTVYITISQSRHGFCRDCAMIWFARLFGHRIICHLHGGNYDKFYSEQPQWLRTLIRKTLLIADHIIVLGERLIHIFDFEPKLREKISVVSNGLPFKTAVASPKTLPATPAEPVQILYLSNLIESKGYLDVLEAVHIVTNSYGLNVEAHFCGEFLSNIHDVRVKNVEHARQYFESFVQNHGLQRKVHYHGVVTGEKKIELLKRSHIFVLPTNFANEGQPISIIEAMAYGNVIISTDYRAIPEMVVHHKNGFLVPYQNPKAIADSIRTLMEKPAVFSEMSRQSVQLFQNKFTWEAHLLQILPFFHDMTAPEVKSRIFKKEQSNGRR